MFTKTCGHTRAHIHDDFVWECVCVSEGQRLIRARFVQLLSDSTPAGKHKQPHTYASPPGLREIIVYLDKYSEEKKKPSFTV